VVVDAVGERDHHGARHAPAEAPRHDGIEGTHIGVIEDLRAIGFADTGQDMVILVVLEKLVHVLPLAVELFFVLLDLANEDDVLELVELAGVP
jgi:hypothetical protein